MSGIIRSIANIGKKFADPVKLATGFDATKEVGNVVGGVLGTTNVADATRAAAEAQAAQEKEIADQQAALATAAANTQSANVNAQAQAAANTQMAAVNSNALAAQIANSQPAPEGPAQVDLSGAGNDSNDPRRKFQTGGGASAGGGGGGVGIRLS